MKNFKSGQLWDIRGAIIFLVSCNQEKYTELQLGETIRIFKNSVSVEYRMIFDKDAYDSEYKLLADI